MNAGIPMLIICGVISSYTGSLLGRCWMIVKQRYPEYNDQQITDPYPKIGFHAAGKWGEVAARICVFFTLFGGGMFCSSFLISQVVVIKAPKTFFFCKRTNECLL